MAIIDLRHLVQPECDTVKFVGSEDKQEYELPVRKTVGMTLTLQQYMNDFAKVKPPSEYDAADSVELGYFMLTAWIRAHYPDKTVEWVKLNVCEDLFTELMTLANEMFFPKVTETGMPKKNRKKGKS